MTSTTVGVIFYCLSGENWFMVVMMKYFVMLTMSVFLLSVSALPAQAVQTNQLTLEKAHSQFSNKVQRRRTGLAAYTRRNGFYRNPRRVDKSRSVRSHTLSFSPLKHSNKGRRRFGIRRFNSAGEAQDITNYYRRPRFSRR